MHGCVVLLLGCGMLCMVGGRLSQVVTCLAQVDCVMQHAAAAFDMYSSLCSDATRHCAAGIQSHSMLTITTVCCVQLPRRGSATRTRRRAMRTMTRMTTSRCLLWHTKAGCTACSCVGAAAWRQLPQATLQQLLKSTSGSGAQALAAGGCYRCVQLVLCCKGRCVQQHQQQSQPASWPCQGLG